MDYRYDPSDGSAICADEVAKPDQVKWFTPKIKGRSFRLNGVNKEIKSIVFLIFCVLLYCLIIMLPLKSSKNIGDIGKVVLPIIKKRSIKTFLIGAGVAAFTMIASGATAFTVASCKASLAAALIGAPIWPATSLACIGSAALTIASSHVQYETRQDGGSRVLSGNRRKLRDIFAQLALKFTTNSAAFPNEPARIGYAASYLWGHAFSLYASLMTEDKLPVETYPQFKAFLEGAFGDPDTVFL
ncbi:hypothetical protein V1505DRAFT_424165 [Lipomyces doorenjongii]